MNILEGIILGVLQGLTEWLPISSSGQGMLVLMQFMDFEPASAFSFSLLLHLGSLFAILFYFRREIAQMIKAGEAGEYPARKVASFLIIATIATGVSGVPFYLLISKSFSMFSGDVATGIIGVLLIATGLVVRKGQGGTRGLNEISHRDSLLVGLLQGFSVLPGISRSGVTIGALLMLGIDAETSLKLSFLLAAPAILGAMALASTGLPVGLPALAGVLASFAVSLAAMKYLMEYSRRANFSSFCMFIGVIAVAASLVTYIGG